MGKSMAPQPRWEMMSGFPACKCSTKPEQLPDELAPGMPRACSHLYVKKSANTDLFHVSVSPATSAGSREGSPGGGGAEKPQGVRVLRGRPVSIVLYPMPPRPTDDMPRTAQSWPTFSSLADERAADDMGVLLMGGVSRANSSASCRRRIVRRSSGRSSPRRRSRSSSADGQRRKAYDPGSVTLKMPSRAFEVDIKLEKVVENGLANSSNEFARRTDMFKSPNGANCNKIRLYKHTISSLISSRIVDMNREARLLQELDCNGGGAHRLQRPPLPARAKANAESRSRLDDSYNKHVQRQPRQFKRH